MIRRVLAFPLLLLLGASVLADDTPSVLLEPTPHPRQSYSPEQFP